MIHVIIATEDATFADRLKSIIVSAQNQFSRLAISDSDQKMLQLVKDLFTIILIDETDLPLQNNMDLIQTIQKQHPKTQTVLLRNRKNFNDEIMKTEQSSKHSAPEIVLKNVLHEMFQEIVQKQENCYETFVRSLIHGDLGTGVSFTNSHRYRHHLLVLCCAELVSSFDQSKEIPAQVFWKQSDWQERLSVQLKGIAECTIVDGATPSEKWLMISFYQQQKDHSVQHWIELVGNLLNQGMNVTISHSNLFHSFDEVRELTKMLRMVLIKHIRLAVSDCFSLADLERTVADPAPDPIFEKEFAFALEQRDLKLVKNVLYGLFVQWQETKPQQNYLARQLMGILIKIQQVFHCSSSYTLDLFYADLSDAMLRALDYDDLYRSTCRMIDLFAAVAKDIVEGQHHDNDLLAQEIEAYIDEHFPEPINHQTLSQRFGLVPSYLSKIFSRYKGISPAKYIVKLRLEATKELLLENLGLTIKDIAYVVGFEDPSYLSRIFKRETGLSPSEFRKQQKVLPTVDDFSMYRK
ncbi:AraC family transcriptional regulator [Halalkalibacterium halodurans]|uniref:AraC family transcriptional regulator n=1 Tax=Halalkalibacterium halodurans TaxID=86665 RepID=UPI0006A987BA|nr:helix-turn-helix domain-containing protein [Halalkalibacterium halodurans]